MIAICLWIALAQTAEPQGVVDLPSELKARYKQEIQQLSFSGFKDDAYYQSFLARLDQRVFGRAEAVRFLHDLTQAMYDHDRGHRWLAALANDLERSELHSIRDTAVPAEIELLQVRLRDGRVLLGTGGPLARHFRGMSEENLKGQLYLEPNLGVPGAGALWLAKGDVESAKRVAHPTPNAILVAAYSESFDEEGRLVVNGHWFRPGRGIQLEKITLDVREVTNGGVWFGNDTLHLQALRYTSQYPALAEFHDLDEAFRREMGWTDEVATTAAPDATAPGASPPAALVDRVAALRTEAPEIDWPAPFNPDPERARAVLARDDLVFGDPAESLLRIRFALTYGDAMPELAMFQPREFLAIERRVMACLDGRPLSLAIDAPADVDTILAAVRHAPRFDLEPGPLAPESPVLLHLPAAYSPWQLSPVLIALHGQGGGPQDEFNAWVELCDQSGVILVCPPHGSSAGGARGKDSDDAILDVLRRVLLSTNADPDRVYITGISMGGARTWHMIQSYPDRFAAAAPEIRGPSRTNGKFRLLPNVKSLPIFQLEGEFDGENTAISRKAIFELKKLGGPAHYLESKSMGHVRMSWRYPAILRSLAEQRRDAHPAVLDHRAFHGFRARTAWLRIVGADKTHAWDREDGAFVIADLTGVRATFARGTVTLKRTRGRPTKIEISHDRELMGDAVQIRGGGKSLRWKPTPSVRHALERVLETGDRSRLFDDSIIVEM